MAPSTATAPGTATETATASGTAADRPVSRLMRVSADAYDIIAGWAERNGRPMNQQLSVMVEEWDKIERAMLKDKTEQARVREAKAKQERLRTEKAREVREQRQTA